MSSLIIITRFSLLLWLPVCVYGATYKMTYEEGKNDMFLCPYRNVAWNVTFNDVSPFTVCNLTLCSNQNSYGVTYMAGFAKGNSYLNISQILRNMTKVLCLFLDHYQIINSWLLSVVVRPTVPVCTTPELSTISKNNYMINIRCKTTVHPEANCSIATMGSFDTWQTRITYDDQKSLVTGLYTTQCTVSLFIFTDTSSGPIQYRATVYPDVVGGKDFHVSNEWRTWLPGELISAQVVSFTANMQTVSLDAPVGTDVTFTCKGVGPPGTTLTLYNFSSDSPSVMKRGDIDEDLIYEITNIQCVATSTIKCGAGDDITTAKEIIVGVLNCPSSECCNNNMILAVVITLTTATVVTLIIVVCCIRLRRRLYKSQARAQHHQEGEHIHINPIQPPPYDEVFHINVAAMDSRHDIRLPDYDSLPPPYAEVVRVDRQSEPSAPLEPGVQEESPARGGHTPAVCPTFML